MIGKRTFLRRFCLPVFLLVAAAPGIVQGDPGPDSGGRSRGIPVKRDLPFASGTLGEVRALSAKRPVRLPGNRVIPRPRISGRGAPDTPSIRAAVPAAPAALASPSSMAPVLSGTFQGLLNPPPGRDVIPPNAMGAAGPFHLVAMPVSDFGVFDKASGALIESVPLDDFWADLVTTGPADFPFDTRVLFDQHSGRFVAVALDCTVNPNSWLMIAVSATDNALGVWNKWAIDADIDGEAEQTQNWADFPGVGIDANNLYVATNMFRDTGFGFPEFQYSKVWVIPKAQLLAGQNPIAWHEFPNPPGSFSTLQPAHVFGPSAAAYVVFEDWNFNATRLLLATIDNVTGTPVWNSPVAVAVAPYNQEFRLPEAPQPVERRGIDTADTRLWNAVYRDGFLWTTHHVRTGNKTEAAWHRIDPATRAVVEGRINDPVRWYYFPSVTVNQDGVAAIGFSGSSSREYAGGYYTILQPNLLQSNFIAEPVALLKSGEDSYFKDFGFGTNRWGDLSATVVDPSDGVTFWTIQEYAWTKDFDPIHNEFRSRWALWWGKFRPSDVPAPGSLTATSIGSAQVNLAWTDQSENEVGFRIERRRLPGGDYMVIGDVGQNTTSFIDNAVPGLEPGVPYSYRVQAFNAGGGSYSAEAFPSLLPAPPEENGGGGCLSVSPSVSDTTDIGAVVSVLLLFLPAAVCWRKRRFRRGSPP